LNIWIGLVEHLYAITHPQHKLNDDKKVISSFAKQTSDRGTYVRKRDAPWLEHEVGLLMPIKIWCWRSVSVRFLRTFIHERFAGRFLLKILYWKEEHFPHFLGKYGQYPLIELSKYS
jgi:hypothetical protein